MGNKCTVERRPGSPFYQVSDATMTVVECPCCRKEMTETAARALASHVEDGWRGMSSLREWSEFWGQIWNP